MLRGAYNTNEKFISLLQFIEFLCLLVSYDVDNTYIFCFNNQVLCLWTHQNIINQPLLTIQQ